MLKRSNKITTCLFYLIWSVLIITNSVRADDLKNLSPKQIVQMFCAIRAERSKDLNKTPYSDLVMWNGEKYGRAEPGWDHITMISKYEIRDSKVDNDEAEVKVLYHILASVAINGYIWPKGHPKFMEDFEKNEFVEVTEGNNFEVTYKLKKTGSGWKIKDPILPPFENKNSVIKQSQKIFNDREKRAKRGERSKSDLYYLKKREKGIDEYLYEELLKIEIEENKNFINTLKSLN